MPLFSPMFSVFYTLYQRLNLIFSPVCRHIYAYIFFSMHQTSTAMCLSNKKLINHQLHKKKALMHWIHTRFKYHQTFKWIQLDLNQRPFNLQSKALPLSYVSLLISVIGRIEIQTLVVGWILFTDFVWAMPFVDALRWRLVRKRINDFSTCPVGILIVLIIIIINSFILIINNCLCSPLFNHVYKDEYTSVQGLAFDWHYVRLLGSLSTKSSSKGWWLG